MAMKTRRRSRAKSMKDKLTKGGIGKKIFPLVKTVSAPISFLEQITAHDRKNLGSTFSNAGYGTQLKIMTNLGSISKSLFVGGLLGGVFSPSEPKSVSPSMSFPTNSMTSYANTNGTYNNGSDSTGSSY